VPDFTFKMYQIQFRLGLRSRPRWGSSLRSLAGFGEREGKQRGEDGERKWKGRGQGKKEKGKGGEGKGMEKGGEEEKGEEAEGKEGKGGGEGEVCSRNVNLF